MGFAAPWLLAAAAALALPVLAHLARHETRRGSGFPSLMFLRRVPFSARARYRIEDRLLFALRALAMLALILAFAGPFLSSAVSGTAGRDTVILLDVSSSMSAGNRSALARDQAGAVIDSARAGDRVALVLFDERAWVASPLEGGPGEAQRALASTRPGHRGTDFATALALGAEVLRGVGARDRRVVLVSDLQRTGAALPAALPADVALDLLVVGEDVGANLSIVDATHQGETLTVDVANLGSAPARSDLAVRVAGLAASRQALMLGPGERRRVTSRVFPGADAQTRVSVSLDEDGFAGDNHRHLTVVPPRALRIGVLAGQEVEYFAAALTLVSEPDIQVVPLTDDVGAAALDDLDVLVLAAPLPAAGGFAAALERRASQGMGLLVFAPGHSPAVGMSIFGPATPAPGGDSLVPADDGHALARALAAGRPMPGVIRRRAALTTASGDVVLSRFDDGAPAIVARTAGEGRQLWVATGIAPGWSGLALRPEFAPWLLESVAWLARLDHATPALEPGSVVDIASAVRGTAVENALASGETLWVRDPDGDNRRHDPQRPLVLEAPGFHGLRAGDAPVLWLAVNPPAGESALQAMGRDAFLAAVERTVPPDRAVNAGDAATDTESGLVRLLLLLGVALLALEGAMGGRLAQVRAGREVPA